MVLSTIVTTPTVLLNYACKDQYCDYSLCLLPTLKHGWGGGGRGRGGREFRCRNPEDEQAVYRYVPPVAGVNTVPLIVRFLLERGSVSNHGRKRGSVSNHGRKHVLYY